MPPTRCAWATGDPLLTAYHDAEWGVPVRAEPGLFELLTLEGAQAGLSWLTVLRKRDGYRRAFHGFDPAAVARMGDADVERLIADPGVVRHRGKLASVPANARAILALQEAGSSLSDLLWGLVDGRPLQPRRRSPSEVPAETPVSRAASRELRRRGFAFCGPTIVYALMQAAGLVNDHTVDCHRFAELAAGEDS
jgi:DNA-3-methyladenine glycosylase I